MKVLVGNEGEIILSEVFSGIVLRTQDHDYGICERDGDIMVLKDYKQVYPEVDDTSPLRSLSVKLSMDGNQWLALIGENLHEGWAGFGAEIPDALENLARDVRASYELFKLRMDITKLELLGISLVKDPPNPHCVIEEVQEITKDDFGASAVYDSEGNVTSYWINTTEGWCISCGEQKTMAFNGEIWLCEECSKKPVKVTVEERDYEGEHGDMQYKAEQENRGPGPDEEE